jgi:hypothetical protein
MPLNKGCSQKAADANYSADRNWCKSLCRLTKDAP